VNAKFKKLTAKKMEDQSRDLDVLAQLQTSRLARLENEKKMLIDQKTKEVPASFKNLIQRYANFASRSKVIDPKARKDLVRSFEAIIRNILKELDMEHRFDTDSA
jgi:uncharacterized protein YaaR (DUF327 family)